MQGSQHAFGHMAAMAIRRHVLEVDVESGIGLIRLQPHRDEGMACQDRAVLSGADV